ncbi:immunity protein Imm33 domain-containing protein [Arthrobacter sp. KNU-44]|uniref:immunity protein Imm33 domain-containing protein n=1 Tax=Arthrobacter sp. KNU-44 TaxID=3450744 RepID=UPI003F41F4A7
MNDLILSAQIQLTARFGAVPAPPSYGVKLGVAENVRSRDVLPLNGLRHPAATGTSGWFIWRGEEIGTVHDFFVPLHIEHLDSLCPEVIPYLALPPGWRFLLAPGYEDVWYDDSLLDV